MEALTGAGFKVPEALGQIPGSNVERNKHYDQIAYYKQTATRRCRPPAALASSTSSSTSTATRTHRSTRRKCPMEPSRTGAPSKMSDHLPMWCEFRIDSMDEYLNQLAKELEH